ncbi:MAG: GPP34 family phosphoprotein [Candidatus Eisenbacteria bacterium]|uniref:GPP34 family phosphoprotein n=1 Tax=Eiseniibacteriota bacterium TaxID=2212470 RepID=A0A956RNR7_UNCEI|nr:GPP34 family phosphoprotein [Candidatus Eisenbacteria bacterium]
MKSSNLTIMEELMLLSLHDQKGSQLAGNEIGFGLAGAALVELLTLERIRLDGDFVRVERTTRTTSLLLDEVLDLLRTADKPKKAKHWIRTIPKKIKPLHHRVAETLVAKGILASEEGRILWIFPVRRYPERSSAPEVEIRQRIRSTLRDHRDPDKRTAGLIALMGACKLTKQVFEKGERREANRQVKELTKSDPFAKTVVKIIEEMQAAVAAAVAASAAAG